MPSLIAFGGVSLLEDLLLRFEAIKRVERALETQLQPGEHLKTSALVFVIGKGDFALGLTDDRLVWVGVTRIGGEPNGRILLDDINTVRVIKDNYLISLGYKVSIRRSDGSTTHVRFGGEWVGRMRVIVARLYLNR